MAVAGAHAEAVRRAGGLARNDALLPRRRRIERARQTGERIGEGPRMRRRLAAMREGVTQSAEQLIEEPGGRRSGRKRRRRDDHARAYQERREFMTGRHRLGVPLPVAHMPNREFNVRAGRKFAPGHANVTKAHKR
jgi:hypothetical protein